MALKDQLEFCKTLNNVSENDIKMELQKKMEFIEAENSIE